MNLLFPVVALFAIGSEWLFAWLVLPDGAFSDSLTTTALAFANVPIAGIGAFMALPTTRNLRASGSVTFLGAVALAGLWALASALLAPFAVLVGWKIILAVNLLLGGAWVVVALSAGAAATKADAADATEAPLQSTQARARAAAIAATHGLSATVEAPLAQRVRTACDRVTSQPLSRWTAGRGDALLAATEELRDAAASQDIARLQSAVTAVETAINTP
jgi:hypothetical protein